MTLPSTVGHGDGRAVVGRQNDPLVVGLVRRPGRLKQRPRAKHRSAAINELHAFRSQNGRAAPQPAQSQRRDGRPARHHADPGGDNVPRLDRLVSRPIEGRQDEHDQHGDGHK